MRPRPREAGASGRGMGGGASVPLTEQKRQICPQSHDLDPYPYLSRHHPKKIDSDPHAVPLAAFTGIRNDPYSPSDPPPTPGQIFSPQMRVPPQHPQVFMAGDCGDLHGFEARFEVAFTGIFERAHIGHRNGFFPKTQKGHPAWSGLSA